MDHNERKAVVRRSVVRGLTKMSGVPLLRPVGTFGMRRIFDSLANDWEKIRAEPVYRDAFNRAMDAIPGHFPTAGTPTNALDVACGTGIASGLLRDRWPDLDLTGIDISPQMIEIARSLVPGVSFDVGSALNLPYDDETYDLIVSLDGLFDIAELSRVAKPGAIIVVVYSRGGSIPIRTSPKDIAKSLTALGNKTEIVMDDAWIVWACKSIAIQA